MANTIREDVAKLKELREKSAVMPFSYFRPLEHGPIDVPSPPPSQITVVCTGTVFHFRTVEALENFLDQLEGR